jgi:SAM-dependent methyltransferase
MAHELDSPRALYDATSAGWVRCAPVTVSDYTGRPPTLDMCRPVEGLRVLDIGCGEGYVARQLRRWGAAQVVGVDISGAMIDAALAAEATEPLGITYRRGDVTRLEGVQDATFDIVLAMFVLNYMTADETRHALAEAFRVLVPGGRLVFAVPHPSLPWLRRPEPPFYLDPGAAGYFSGRDQRFPGRIARRDGGMLDVQAVHKTFEDYFHALGLAGFDRMPTIRELAVTPDILAVDPELFGPLRETPLHVAVSVSR